MNTNAAMTYPTIAPAEVELVVRTPMDRQLQSMYKVQQHHTFSMSRFDRRMYTFAEYDRNSIPLLPSVLLLAMVSQSEFLELAPVLALLAQELAECILDHTDHLQTTCIH